MQICRSLERLRNPRARVTRRYLHVELHWEGRFLIWSHYSWACSVWNCWPQKKTWKKTGRGDKEERGEENRMTYKVSADVTWDDLSKSTCIYALRTMKILGTICRIWFRYLSLNLELSLKGWVRINWVKDVEGSSERKEQHEHSSRMKQHGGSRNPGQTIWFFIQQCYSAKTCKQRVRQM